MYVSVEIHPSSFYCKCKNNNLVLQDAWYEQGVSVRNEVECDMPSDAECKAHSEEGD